MDQEAKINITAYDSSVYGALDGKVIAISPDATLNERTGERFYTVRVAPNDKLLAKNSKPLEIGSGMIADVQIGRASCRDSVCQYVSIPVVAVSLQNKNKLHTLKQ